MNNIEFLENDFNFADGNKLQKEEKILISSFWNDFLTRFKQNKGAVISSIIILIIIGFAIFAPMFSSHQATVGILNNQSLGPRIPVIENLGIFNGSSNGVNKYEILSLDNLYHYFGTDTLGRDLWVRVWSGTRISLFVAFVAVVIDVIIGMSYGLISGYFGGKVDAVMQRVQEIINSIPSLVIMTLLLLVMKASLLTIIIALMLTGWIGMSRITRAQVLKIKEQEFVLASKTLGASGIFIIFKEILPNIFGQIIVMSMFTIPSAIFYEAFLAFVGLGVPAPQSSLGSLINDGFKSTLVSPYMVVIPAVILAILMLCFNLFADGLKDAFDPKMKEM